jgi:hypothetical protein
LANFARDLRSGEINSSVALDCCSVENCKDVF